MQLVALLSSALAFFDAAPAPANPKLNAVVLVHGIHSSSLPHPRHR